MCFQALKKECPCGHIPCSDVCQTKAFRGSLGCPKMFAEGLGISIEISFEMCPTSMLLIYIYAVRILRQTHPDVPGSGDADGQGGNKLRQDQIKVCQ